MTTQIGKLNNGETFITMSTTNANDTIYGTCTCGGGVSAPVYDSEFSGATNMAEIYFLSSTGFPTKGYAYIGDLCGDSSATSISDLSACWWRGNGYHNGNSNDGNPGQWEDSNGNTWTILKVVNGSANFFKGTSYYGTCNVGDYILIPEYYNGSLAADGGICGASHPERMAFAARSTDGGKTWTWFDSSDSDTYWIDTGISDSGSGWSYIKICSRWNQLEYGL